MMKIRILLASLLLTASGLGFAHGNLADVVASGSRAHALTMISEGTDVNAQQADGTTALLYAIHQGDEELVAALIEAGADVNHSNLYGASALFEAAVLGSSSIIEMLLDKGADANWRNPEGETALMVVARSGNIPAAKVLLAHGADINAREHWGAQSAIMWAAAQSQPEMLRFLIDQGADINAHGLARLWNRRITSEPRPKDMNKGGFSPLLYAARQGCTECVKILAAAGADLNATDPDRVSALNLALINLHFDTAATLIEAGADVNQWDLFGRAPLYNAIDLHTLPIGGRPDIPSDDALTGLDIAKMLLLHGANPNMQLKLRPPYRNAVFDRGADNILSTGATPLMRAARAADNESVKLLLAHGALVDLPNARGQTPLMVVAGIDYPSAPTRGRYKTEEDSIETIRLLLAAGANINALTGDPALRIFPDAAASDRGAGMQPAIRGAAVTDGQTALHGAAKQGWTDIAKYLIDHGARQQVVDAAGRTPFDLAMGRYPPAFLEAPAEPLVETAMLLQNECLNDDNCTMSETIDFSNPSAIK
ncbi:MAG: ankyrin repeat domain-containing protein [Pseudomonadales bacterium]|nr:ankyrin repeat domain-containing protein [Pseudomonadales bacterium]